MLGVFGWLRAQARDAVLGGIEDAVRVVTPEGGEPAPDLAALRARLAALTAPAPVAALPVASGAMDASAAADEPTRGRRKGA